VLGSGIAGLLNIKLAKAYGAEKVIATDVSDYRLDAAKRFGAHTTLKAGDFVPNLVRKENKDRLADYVIVCTGATKAMKQAFECVDRGGKVLMFAPPMPGVSIPVPFGDLWKDEVTITSTYAGSPRDIKEAIELMRSRKVVVSDMITHRFGLADTDKGFALVAKAQDSMKVIVEPQR
jgi:L-iditol 2-dehydrogenase